jgi:uncharacterized phage protein (predicted DNA packaging)
MVTLDDMKAHLNITTDQDDALITAKLAVAERVAVAFTGISTDSNYIPNVDEAIRQLAAYLYENREASPTGIPQGVLDLLAPYRIWTF